ncbi:hypothetical protein [Wolbachia pipientis]|nr:hypothetical protein [Wolbachia pipientis]MDM8335196.1 hypothetical protein [Wolbachia pipientis]
MSLNRREIDNKSDNPTINLEFQAKAEIVILAIKDKIKNCGFKIK